MEDLQEFISRLGLPRMDPGAIYTGKPEYQYSVSVNGTKIPFRFAEMAPPCGVFAQNYARPTHTENQPHQYSISWTTGRQGTPSDGGHFYNSTLGIRVQGAANTVVIWKPKDIHGTSLPLVDPADRNPPVLQTGLAIVTSNRLPAIFKKYREGLDHSEAAEECFGLGEEVDDDIDAEE
ncbi:hypothetical protein MPER_04261 [Moniliophthora perniciosa FA553]|nr:hypothetical protein MPER_04261 [Moniliophthora perniciosa FA553]